MDTEVVVIGAGISGLTCARQLARAGQNVLVLEKSRGVGGRSATRRFEGCKFDHGLTFYHGSDLTLRAELERIGRDAIVSGWPRNVRGKGAPCQPRAFREGEWRLACTNGANAFAKDLASELDIRLKTRVVAVEPADDHWRIVDEGGQQVTARDMVLALPAPQASALVDAWDDVPQRIESLRWLLRGIGYVRVLTVIALYPVGGVVPDWEMWHPEESVSLQLISHESSKRPEDDRTALVIQASPSWSHAQWARPETEWSAAMLEETGRLAGSWAARPETVQTHRWRFARVGGGGDLSGPLSITLPEGRRLGFIGDGFSPGGGVQAAWRSGHELARRLSQVQSG